MSINKIKVIPTQVEKLYNLAIQKGKKLARKNTNKAAVQVILKQFPDIGKNWLYRNLKGTLKNNKHLESMEVDRNKLNHLNQFVHGTDTLYKNNYTVLEIEEAESPETVLKRFEHTKWWLYYYYETIEKEGVLARAVLTFEEDEVVSIQNKVMKDETNYKGTVNAYVERHLMFNLTTDPYKRKPLRIHTYIGHGNLYSLMLGSFCNINKVGAMEAGTVILHRINEKGSHKPCILKKGSAEYQQVPSAIRAYFAKKEKNFIKAPARPLSLAALDQWLVTQTNKQKQKTLDQQKKYQLVLTTPNCSLKNPTNNINKKELEAISETLINYCDFSKEKTQYYGLNEDINAMIKEPRIIFELMQERVSQTEHLIVIYPDICNSSTIAELSWAIQLKIPTVIFCKQKKDLPFIFQGDLSKHGCYTYEYKQLEDIHTLIKLYKIRLFGKD